MKIVNILKTKIKNKGGILVEFALSIPFLVSILYFSLDVPKRSLMETKMKNTTFFAISMIQNISQNRANNVITKHDLEFIITTSFMNIFRGLEQFNLINDPNDRNPWGLSYIYYVKGLPDGKASTIWRWDSRPLLSSPSRDSITYTTDTDCSTVRYKTNVDPDQIHKDLIISDGDVKIIVETIYAVTYDNSSTDDDSDIHDTINRTLGFYLIKPRSLSAVQWTFFSTVTIFTPRPGLFSETPPNWITSISYITQILYS